MFGSLNISFYVILFLLYRCNVIYYLSEDTIYSFTFLRLFFVLFLAFLEGRNQLPSCSFCSHCLFGSVFHIRSFYQMAGILGHHSHLRVMAIKGWLKVLCAWSYRPYCGMISEISNWQYLWIFPIGLILPPLSCVGGTSLARGMFSKWNWERRLRISLGIMWTFTYSLSGIYSMTSYGSTIQISSYAPGKQKICVGKKCRNTLIYMQYFLSTEEENVE